LPLGDESEQLSVASKIQNEGWSVRATELWVQERLRAEDAEESSSMDEDDAPVAPKASRGTRTTSHQIAALEKELRMSLGTKVDIRQTAKGRGRIVIHFTSEDEFDRLHEFLAPPEFNSGRAVA
jgi:ParB family transcriptional regulator, chromosome partitioning protein